MGYLGGGGRQTWERMRGWVVGMSGNTLISG